MPRFKPSRKITIPPRDFFERLKAPRDPLSEGEKTLLLAEIAERYTWNAEQRRKPVSKPHLLMQVRLRELERLFFYRYGGALPNDDFGWGDLVIAAHTIAGLGGEVIEHILAWGRVWAPWLPDARCRALAKGVAANPRKFKADTLGWRLRLSSADRAALEITTIGAFDRNREQRAAERKKKQAAAARIRRAGRSTGNPRGRPTKNASSAGRKKKEEVSGGDAFIPPHHCPATGTSAKGTSEVEPASTAAPQATPSPLKRRREKVADLAPRACPDEARPFLFAAAKRTRARKVGGAPVLVAAWETLRVRIRTHGSLQ